MQLWHVREDQRIFYSSKRQKFKLFSIFQKRKGFITCSISNCHCGATNNIVIILFDLKARKLLRAEDSCSNRIRHYKYKGDTVSFSKQYN